MTSLHDNQQTRSVEFSKSKKGHEPDKPDSDSLVDPDPEPSLSDSSSKTSSSDLSTKKKKGNKKRKCRKHWKDGSSDPYSSDGFDYSNDSAYRCKRRKKKNHQEKDPIKLCPHLTGNLLTTAYKS